MVVKYSTKAPKKRRKQSLNSQENVRAKQKVMDEKRKHTTKPTKRPKPHNIHVTTNPVAEKTTKTTTTMMTTMKTMEHTPETHVTATDSSSINLNHTTSTHDATIEPITPSGGSDFPGYGGGYPQQVDHFDITTHGNPMRYQDYNEIGPNGFYNSPIFYNGLDHITEAPYDHHYHNSEHDRIIQVPYDHRYHHAEHGPYVDGFDGNRFHHPSNFDSSNSHNTGFRPSSPL